MHLAFLYAKKFSLHPCKRRNDVPLMLSFIKEYGENVVCFQQHSFPDNKKLDKKFVVKACPSKDMLVAELFGSDIGTSVGIKMSKATVLPTNTFFEKEEKSLRYDSVVEMIRANNTSAASYESVLLLITHVPGKPFKKDIDIIKLLYDPELVKYQDLCNLCAVDIFVNNNDRYARNVYYDENPDNFYGIDMDNECYVLGNLSHLFGKNFENLINLDLLSHKETEIKALLNSNNEALKAYIALSSCQKKNLSWKQRNALMTIKIMLKKLSTLYPLERMCDLWLSKCENIGWEVNDAQKTLFHTMFEVNYYWIKKVMEILEYLGGNLMYPPKNYQEIVTTE